MLYTGVILETRIWGELCSFTAVAVVLLLEDYIERYRQGESADRAAEAWMTESVLVKERVTETVGR